MSAQPEKGTVVGARYRLDTVLGEGGMAVVWRAQHTETDRPVALKLVRREFVKDDQVREMFVREARIAARIGANRHIVDVLDAGVDANLEVPFIAMELLHGEPLDARIKEQGPVPAALAADWIEQLAEALDQAHGAGVIHRDLKPQNVFLARDKKQRVELKVLDFGIAKLAESAKQSSTHVGTPAYSAPEQLGPSWRTIAEQRGKTIASHVSPATDVWALGLVLFEMLVGATSGAFWGATTVAELPVKIVLEPTPIATARAEGRAALLPSGFDAWIARCLDLDAERRFQSAGDAASAIAPMLRSMRASMPDASAPQRPTLPSAAPPPVSGATVPTPSGGAVQSAPLPSSMSPGTPRPPFPSGSMAFSPSSLVAQPHGTPLPNPPGDPRAWAPQGSPPFAQNAATPLPSPPAYAIIPPGADPRLAAWATMRRAEIRLQIDPRPYVAWNPFQFIGRVMGAARDARAGLRDAQIVFAEIVIDDALRRATGEDRFVVGMITSPRIVYRAALRTKNTSLADGMARGLRILETGEAPHSPSLGDPRLEAFYDLSFPSPQEGHLALPFALRQLLLSTGFRGVLELRQGAFVLKVADALQFDPIAFEKIADLASQIYAIFAP